MAFQIIDRLRTFCKIHRLLRRGLAHSPLVRWWYYKEPTDEPQAGRDVQDHFADLPNSRQLRPEDHPLIPLISFCAVLWGAEHFTEMEVFGQAKEDWFSQHLDFSRRTPSQDIFYRVFRLLDPEAFGHCFVAWTRVLVELTHREVVALDSKSVRCAVSPA